jgi:hypothetical protein
MGSHRAVVAPRTPRTIFLWNLEGFRPEISILLVVLVCGFVKLSSQKKAVHSWWLELH